MRSSVLLFPIPKPYRSVISHVLRLQRYPRCTHEGGRYARRLRGSCRRCVSDLVEGKTSFDDPTRKISASAEPGMPLLYARFLRSNRPSQG